MCRAAQVACSGNLDSLEASNLLLEDRSAINLTEEGRSEGLPSAY
jgi:hypothetical protein